MAIVTRETRETRVRVVLRAGADASARADAAAEAAAIKGTGAAARASSGGIATREPFLDHMLVTLARYAGVQLEVEAAGDLRHHLIEDVAITLGMTLRREVPGACARYGSAVVPMDEALVHAALDLGGRFYYEGPLPSSLYDHFLRSFAEHAGMALHVRVLRGTDRHHVVEAAVKAVGLALRQALEPTGAVFSTKGAIDVTEASE